MTLAAPALDRFRSTFEGDIVQPGDPVYDDARRVWSALFDRRPAAVVRPTTVDDVAAAIRMAREADLAISVRGGGHSISGFSTCDDGLVIDLSRMRGVTVDPAARIARANGGALLAELDQAAQAHGLVCPVGVVGHTGVGGLALGGGVGRLQRPFGLTVDNLVAVELITADGRLARTSATEEPDLFWAIRGAGPNFGVVTAFEFRLHPFGPNLTRGFRIYGATDALAVWQAFRSFATVAPREVSLSFVISRAVPEAEYPPEIAGGPVALIAFSHIGNEAQALADLAPLDGVARPVVEAIATTAYLEIQLANDEVMAWGQRFTASGGFADDLQPSTIAALVDHAASAGGDIGFTASMQGGAIADVADSAMAFAGHAARFRTLAEAQWQDPAEDAASIEWCQQAMAIAAPDAVVGRYVNEVEEGTDPAAIYGPDKIGRLVALKRAWDPDNAFHLNHNIRP